MTGDEELIAAHEVARIRGVSVRQVVRLAQRGRIPVAAKAPGLRGAYLFRREDVVLPAEQPVAADEDASDRAVA